MKDKKVETPELQLQLVEAPHFHTKKKSANERASIFLADINLLYTEILLLEENLRGESEYVLGKQTAFALVKSRLKAAIEKL